MGTPQGGILSPLLANIVLNEFDHWIVNQWSNFKTEKTYTTIGGAQKSLKKSKLKEMFYVRYADDFRIMTNSYENAEKIFHAVKMWLKERLHLEISEEKSSIIDLRKKNMKFLGILFKAMPNQKQKPRKKEARKKRKKNMATYSYSAQTTIDKETMQKILNNAKERIIKIKHTIKHKNRIKAVMDYQSYIRGLQFYSVTTKWCKISNYLEWNTRKTRYNRLRKLAKTLKRSRDGTQQIGIGKSKRNVLSVNDIQLLKITDIKHQDYVYFNKNICKYTVGVEN